MHIDLDIDGELIRRAAKLTGTKDPRELIERALSLLISTREHENINPGHAHMLWDEPGDDPGDDTPGG